MLGRGGQRDAFEVRPFFLVVKKKGHLLTDVDNKTPEHRFDLRRTRAEFFEREGEGYLLFGAPGTFHNQSDFIALLKSNGIGSEATCPNQNRRPFSSRYNKPTLLHRFLSFPPSPGLKFSTLKGHISKCARSQTGSGRFLISSLDNVCNENLEGFSSRAIKALSVLQNHGIR